MPHVDQRTVASLAVGLALLVLVPALALRQPPSSVGEPSRSASPVAGEHPAAPPTETAPGPVLDATPDRAPAIPTSSARLADLAPPTAIAEPVEVRIPALGIHAEVVPAGVEPDGRMEIPEDVATAGWYRHGPVPGEEGSALISSHVDGRLQGPGAFFDLQRAQPGQDVEVVDADGQVRRFTVRARERLPKEDIPLDELFRTSGPPALVLVTCGGAFDDVTNRYEDNVVVYAEPA